MFARHAGNQLKKWIGKTHDQVSFDSSYTFIEVAGKVVYRSDPEVDDTNLMVLRSEEMLKVNRRCVIATNPEIGKFANYNSEVFLEPGDVPTVYIHNYEGSFEEMGLDWLFRIYFIK